MNKQNRGGAIAAPKKIISLILAAVMLLLAAGVIGYFVSEPSVGGTVTELPPVMDGDGNGMDGFLNVTDQSTVLFAALSGKTVACNVTDAEFCAAALFVKTIAFGNS